MFLNGNTNRSASRITTQNQSRVVLNNVIDRRNPRSGVIVGNNLNNTDMPLLEAQGGALIYSPEPIAQNDFYTKNQKLRDARLPMFISPNNPIITTTYSSITYSNVIRADNTISYSLQILSQPSSGSSISITTDSNTPPLVSIYMSNLRISTIYSTTLVARNNFGVRFFTLPDITTNILAPPQFPSGQNIRCNIFFDSILYSNIHISEYAEQSLFSIFPVYPFATKLSVGYTSNYIDLFVWGLSPNSNYNENLITSNILSHCNLILPTTRTLPITTPRFQIQTGIVANTTSNTLTYSNIIGATNVNSSTQYAISLKNGIYTIPTNMYSANIGLEFKFGAPSNVFLTISGTGLLPGITYIPTLNVKNSIGNTNLTLTTLTTSYSVPYFLDKANPIISSANTTGSTHTIIFKGATSINSVPGYSLILVGCNSTDTIQNITLQLNTFYQSNVRVNIQNLIKYTTYRVSLIASNSLGTDSVSYIFRQG